MNYVQRQIETFIDSGKNLGDISYDMMEYWARKGDFVKFKDFDCGDRGIVFEVGENFDFFLTTKKILLKKASCGCYGDNKIRYFGVRDLYDEICDKILDEEEKIFSQMTDNVGHIGIQDSK